MSPHPSHLRGWRTDQGSLFSFDLSPSSPRVLRSPTVSLAVRNASFVAGSFACPSSPCAPLPVSSLPCLLSLLRYGMVGTVAGDGAPRSLSVGRSSGVRWTRPFSFSDSSLVGLRPFSLPLFHPARAFCAVFVALSCHLRYWLGFYLNCQLLTTVSPLFIDRLLQLFTIRYAQANLHQVKRLSILVANSMIIYHVLVSNFAASPHPWNNRCLPPRTVDMRMRALGVAN